MTVFFSGNGPSLSFGLPAFRVDLGLGQRISGRLESLTEREVVLGDASAEGRIVVARSGVDALVQRPGETLVLNDGFEALDTGRWAVVGEPEIVKTPRLNGEHCLRMPAGGASLTYRLPDAVASGRLDVGFHDEGNAEPGQKWFVDLTFRSVNGPETVRAVLGWSEDSLAVETVGGPALAVQRLARSQGWHRLTVRFGVERCEVAVDGNELAHGKGFGGPLVEIRLASATTGPARPSEGLRGHLDDLRVVRFAEPAGDLEVDATQDEVRLTGGDQVFGSVRTADPEKIKATVDGSEITFRWSEVSGLHLRRTSTPGQAVKGLLVRAEWRSARGNDPRDLDRIEGALTGLSATALTLATPYSGSLAIPRDRLTRLVVLGEGVRVVVDPKSHHLGDNIATMPPLLDPPQPEGGVLERTLELEKIPPGDAFLVLDVVQLVGEAPDLPYVNKIKKGELRTNVALNGTPFDYLNHFITTGNETPERIRVPIPNGRLRVGRNVIRFEQVGVENNPNYLDDMGLLGVALEFTSGGGARRVR